MSEKNTEDRLEALLQRIPRHSKTGDVLPNANDWITRHFDAISAYQQNAAESSYQKRYSGKARNAHERALILMLQGWLAYADAHAEQFGGTEPCEVCQNTSGHYPNVTCPVCKTTTGMRTYGRIADDGFLGPEWLAIGKGIRALLNGESGRLDCGTLDSVLLDGMAKGGVDLEKEGL